MSQNKLFIKILLIFAIIVSASFFITTVLLKLAILNFKITKIPIFTAFFFGFFLAAYALNLISECTNACKKLSITIKSNNSIKLAAQFSPKYINYLCPLLALISFLLGPMKKISFTSNQIFTYTHALGFSSYIAAITFLTIPIFLSAYNMKGSYIKNLVLINNENT